VFLRASKKQGQPLSQDGWPFVSLSRFGNRWLRAIPKSVCSSKQQKKQTLYEAGCEPGRRIGRRAKSSTEATPRLIARIAGFWLAAKRATPASQVFCARYRDAMQTPMTANPSMKIANAAKSSRTK